MIPIGGLDSVRVFWFQLEGENFVLYGFLLYTNADTGIWSYVQNGGMLDLDHITGDRCAVFVLDEPPADFVKEAKKKNHVWYRYFSESRGADSYGSEDTSTDSDLGGEVGSFSRNTLQSLRNCVVVIGSENHIAAESLVDGAAIDRDEIGKVLDHFALDFGRVPCITWFRSLDDSRFEVVDLKTITDAHSARLFFRTYFTSESFRRLLKVA